MIAAALEEVMRGDVNRTIGLTGHPHLSMYVTNLGDRPGLLIDVELPEGSAIEDSQGFDIVEVLGTVRSRVLIRPTRAGAASPAFLGLVEFIFRETSTSGSRAGAVTALVEAVNEFRRFFARRKDRLSESAIRGLFAELELLLELVEVGLAPQDVLQAWSGPYRGIDLRFVDSSGIEVKSTRVPARSVQISSEHQLVAPPGGLHLFVRPLTTVSPEDSVGTALLDLVARVQSTLVKSSATRTLWDSAIEALGFDDTDAYYRQWRFVATSWQAYFVLEGFPKLTPADLPGGVSSVSYDLELEPVESFREDHRSVLEEVATAYE